MTELNLSSGAGRVQSALNARGLSLQVVELPGSTRTAQDAANTIGCMVGQIAKSLIFKSQPSGRPVLIITSGDNRVEISMIEPYLGESLGKANADFVRAATGFAIGGIPPLGYPNPVTTFIDKDLFRYEEIWAAAGTPHAVFCLKPADLEPLTGGKIVTVC